MNKDLKEFLSFLNAKNVDYIIVGGITVVYYGYPRYTGDIDIWVNKSESNAKKIIEVIKEFGFADFGLTVEDLTEDNMVFQFGVEPNRINIITDVDGLNFNDAKKFRKKVTIGDVDLFLISLNDLKKNKKKSGRYKDLDDLENLP